MDSMELGCVDGMSWKEGGKAHGADPVAHDLSADTAAGEMPYLSRPWRWECTTHWLTPHEELAEEVEGWQERRRCLVYRHWPSDFKAKSYKGRYVFCKWLFSLCLVEGASGYNDVRRHFTGH